MVIFYRIVAMLGGLAMFLYGMRIMGDGLKSSSGGAMKNALAKVTNKPFLGFLLGMLVTCVIQAVHRHRTGCQRRYRHNRAGHPTDGPEVRGRQSALLL